MTCCLLKTSAACIQEDTNNEQKSPENTHGEEEQSFKYSQYSVTSRNLRLYKIKLEDTSIQSFGEFNKDSVEEEVARGSDSAVHTVEKEQDNITFDERDRPC